MCFQARNIGHKEGPDKAQSLGPCSRMSDLEQSELASIIFIVGSFFYCFSLFRCHDMFNLFNFNKWKQQQPIKDNTPHTYLAEEIP